MTEPSKLPKLLRKMATLLQLWVNGTGNHMSSQGYDYSEVLTDKIFYNPPMRLDEDGDGKHDKVVKHIGYTTDIITDLALNWMKSKR